MSARKIMVFQHVAHEPLGTLNPMLKAAGFRIRYVNFGRDPEFQPELDGYSGLIVLGGPMGVYEADRVSHLRTEMRAIEHALKMNIPVLGICLGAQLLAHVLGATVEKKDEVEIGWHDVHLTEAGHADALLESWQKTERIFQWHQDGFRAPTSAVHLAQSERSEGQAFRYGDKVYGFQFHLEVDTPMIHRWLGIASNQEMIRANGGEALKTKVRAETDAHIALAYALSERTFGAFIDLFNLPERPILLGTDHGKE